MVDLSPRQKDLLKAIVETYVKTGEPIGSEYIEKEYNLGVSPATIRNEMVRLTEAGFLKQPHTSAGRTPTSMGFRVYISELMKEKELPVSAEVAMKQAIWEQRYQQGRLLQEAVRGLAKRCRMLSVATTNDGDVYYAGAANILDFPEFEDIDVTRFVLGLFDEFPALEQLIGKAVGQDPLHILFGDELDYAHLGSTGFAFSRYMIKDNIGGVIGVIGPARMNYPIILPYIKYVARLIQEASRSW